MHKYRQNVEAGPNIKELEREMGTSAMSPELQF